MTSTAALDLAHKRRQAIDLFTQGQYADADRILAELANVTDADGAQIALRRAQIGMLSDRMDQVEQQLEIARPVYGAHADFVTRLAEMAERKGDLPTAVKYLHMLGRHARAHQLDGMGGIWYEVQASSTRPVALDTEQALPLFEVQVNGETGRFALDTGSADCLLDADFARRAGVQKGYFDRVSYAGGRTGHLQLARIDQLSIGESRFDRLPAIIAPLGGRFRHDFVDASIDGTIGVGVLRAAGGIDIDYGRSRFCLGSPGVRQGQPLWIGGSHYPLISCRVHGGPPSSWFVDTGMSGIDLACSPGAARRYGAEPLSETGRQADDDSGALPVNAVRLRCFEHAVLTDASVPAALLTDFALGRDLGLRIGGIIGHQWLAKHRVQLDYRAMQTRISEGETA